MRERVKRVFNDFQKALLNLEHGALSAVDELDIDGALKRFELCYELAWKLIKEALADRGIICKNPRDCFKQAYANELIQDQKIWLKMIEDRNLLVHSYDASVSRGIFEDIKEEYLPAFHYLKQAIEQELADE